jgi:glycosyltransferase involved in cell wall biosynthesis
MPIEGIPSADRGMNSPVLSVVIPSFNVAPYIRAAVESALNQTFRQIEVIVVNDGSTDHTPEILRQIEEQHRDGRLIVIDQQNGGLAAARNTGICYSNGKYIGFLDADDLWHRQKAERHVAVMEADASVGLTFSHSSYMREDGQPLEGLQSPSKSEPSLLDMINSNHAGNGSSPVVRRECFALAGLFNEQLRSCEDWEMWCRILHQTHLKAAVIPERLTIYRLRETSLTYQFDAFLKEADAAVASLRARMPEVSSWVMRQGHAEMYRLMAWRAATSRHRLRAARYFGIALYLCPWLFWHNWRVVATLATIFLPERFRAGIQRKFHARWQRA